VYKKVEIFADVLAKTCYVGCRPTVHFLMFSNHYVSFFFLFLKNKPGI